MITKNVPTRERALLLETFSLRKDFSQDLLVTISQVIKRIGLKSGSEASEAKAKEIRLMIEAGTSETDILDALKTM